jgi:putative membrane protein
MMKLAALHLAPALVVAAALAVSGCKNNTGDKTPYAADSVGNGTTTSATPGTPSGDSSEARPGVVDTTTAVAPTVLTDANIFAKLDAANSAEIDQGKLGSEKAKSAAVKKLAQMLITDHTAMRQKGADLAKRLNIAPQFPANDSSAAQAQRAMDMLNAASPATFDSVFLAVQVDGHQRTLDDLNGLQAMATNDSLKSLIGGAMPTVRHHLDDARALQSKSGAK